MAFCHHELIQEYQSYKGNLTIIPCLTNWSPQASTICPLCMADEPRMAAIFQTG